MTPEQLAAMAPAAGDGFGRELAARLLVRADFLQKMEEAAIRGLEAKTRRWDKDSNDWLIDDDCRTQAVWFFGLTANMIGEPIKRIIHQHVGDAGKVDPLQALRDSPALAEQAQRMLDKANWRKAGKAAHKVPGAAPSGAHDVEIESQ